MSSYDTIKDLNIQQFKESENFNKLLQVFTPCFDELSSNFDKVKLLLDIDTQEGANLDLIGNIVVQKREGDNDEDYRENIKLKILKNTSTGLVEDIIEILKLITSADKVIYSDNSPAAYTIYTNGQSIPNNINDIMDKVSAAGVSLEVYGTADGSKPIVFYDLISALSDASLIDNNDNLIVTNTSDNVSAKIIQNIDRILFTFENEEAILNEDGTVLFDESDPGVDSLKFISTSTYELFDGVTLGVNDVDNLVDNNGNIIVTNTNAELGVASSNIISEGKLNLKL